MRGKKKKQTEQLHDRYIYVKFIRKEVIRGQNATMRALWSLLIVECALCHCSEKYLLLKISALWIFYGINLTHQLVWYQILVLPFSIDAAAQFILNKLNPWFIYSRNWISLEQQGLDTENYVPKIQNFTNCAVFLGKNFLMFHFIELANLLWFSFNAKLSIFKAKI